MCGGYEHRTVIEKFMEEDTWKKNSVTSLQARDIYIAEQKIKKTFIFY